MLLVPRRLAQHLVRDLDALGSPRLEEPLQLGGVDPLGVSLPDLVSEANPLEIHVGDRHRVEHAVLARQGHRAPIGEGGDGHLCRLEPGDELVGRSGDELAGAGAAQQLRRHVVRVDEATARVLNGHGVGEVVQRGISAAPPPDVTSSRRPRLEPGRWRATS